MKFSFAAKAAFLLSSAVLATAATAANVVSPYSVLLDVYYLATGGS